MIDTALLRKMGWSDQLIEAVDRVAEPLRKNAAAGIPLPTSSARSITSSAIYGEAVIQNTATVVEVTAEQRQTSGK